jgi:two-component system NtrC family sensor kinase
LNVVEWLEEGVLLFDAQDGIRVMNSRFVQMAGFAPGESAGITTLDALIARLSSHAAEPQRFAERWRELARGIDAGIREEVSLSRPVPRVLERAARPILDAGGGRLGRVEIYRDLTAQRVFHSKLMQTEKLAALGQMVTGVAHELSNPLTSILGYAQRLLLQNEGSAQSPEARRIFQEAERATAILRQVLMTARDAPPEHRRVALNQVVSRTIELQRFNLSVEKIRVELDLDARLPLVTGDAGQLQQVLMNLMVNARQAIEQQGRGGTIRLRTKSVGENRVLLEISDDGPGISESIRARIFDPFFTTKAAGVGTGLGLAIVLGIAREHGGRVKVSNSPSGGALFSIEFPGTPVERLHAATIHASGSGAIQSESLNAQDLLPAFSAVAVLAKWTGAQVLVVEDEPTVAQLIADVLEDEGLHVDMLLDGRALESAASERYDLIICDMKMPEFDAQDFYSELVRTGNPLRKRFFLSPGMCSPRTRMSFWNARQCRTWQNLSALKSLSIKCARLSAPGKCEKLPAQWFPQRV